MKNKKFLKIIIIILALILLLSVIMGVSDYFRVRRDEKPMFTLPVTSDDGGSGTYYGLGYTIELRGNFTPDHPLPGIKYVKYSVFGVPVDEIYFE